MHFKYKDSNRLQGLKSVYDANSDKKRAQVAILTSSKKTLLNNQWIKEEITR